MARIVGLLAVVLMVEDLERAVFFYRDFLGLPVISPPDPPAIVLQVGMSASGVPQQLILQRRLAGGPAPSGRQILIEVAAEDFQAELDRCAQLGLPVRPEEHPFLPLRLFSLVDPDGNEVAIVARSTPALSPRAGTT
jgi:catechol 2,3-dioxygenase-like lactoylglutathione lyase family enzyme